MAAKGALRKASSSLEVASLSDRPKEARLVSHSVSFTTRPGANGDDPDCKVLPPARGDWEPHHLEHSSAKSVNTSATTSMRATKSSSATQVAHSPSVCVSNHIHCKLCFCDYPPREMVQLAKCRCLFCAVCLSTYVALAIEDGDVLRISCPDGACPATGRNTIESSQIRQIVDADLFATYVRFRTLREIDNDPNGTWCPSVGCETVCHVCHIVDSKGKSPPQPVTCPKCQLTFCSHCKSAWHGNSGKCDDPVVSAAAAAAAAAMPKAPLETAEAAMSRSRSNFFAAFLRRGPVVEAPNAQVDASPIKRCPICHILIEREEGCAQMMCKRCKHVFCWYCLESLDNDFLLRHYDRGPCKNKLGHSRASVIWHRTQVVGIFAGFGMLLLMASPFLLLAVPCILCCKCSCCTCLDVEAEGDWNDHNKNASWTSSKDNRERKRKSLSEEFEDVPSLLNWRRNQKSEKKKAVTSNEELEDLEVAASSSSQ